jgi:hypothetical protein
MVIEVSYNYYLTLYFINLETIILFLKTFTTLYFPKNL